MRSTKLSILLAIFLATVLGTPSVAQAAAPSTNSHMAWFNARDRMVRVEGKGPVVITLHSSSGKWVETIFKGSLDTGKTLLLSQDYAPGLYILRIRQAGGQSLERLTLF